MNDTAKLALLAFLLKGAKGGLTAYTDTSRYNREQELEEEQLDLRQRATEADIASSTSQMESAELARQGEVERQLSELGIRGARQVGSSAELEGASVIPGLTLPTGTGSPVNTQPFVSGPNLGDESARGLSSVVTPNRIGMSPQDVLAAIGGEVRTREREMSEQVELAGRIATAQTTAERFAYWNLDPTTPEGQEKMNDIMGLMRREIELGVETSEKRLPLLDQESELNRARLRREELEYQKLSKEMNPDQEEGIRQISKSILDFANTDFMISRRAGEVPEDTIERYDFATDQIILQARSLRDQQMAEGNPMAAAAVSVALGRILAAREQVLQSMGKDLVEEPGLFDRVWDEMIALPELGGTGGMGTDLGETGARGGEALFRSFMDRGKVEGALEAPILPGGYSNYRITGRPGDPRDSGSRRHANAVDFAVPYGTPIFSPFSGTVVDSTRSRLGGNTIRIRDESTGKEVLIAHLSEQSPLKKGDTISPFDVIGYSGASGNATGNTVHIELKDDEEDIMRFLGLGQ